MTTALGIAEAANDLLRMLLWEIPDDADVAEAREAVSTARQRMCEARDMVDAVWTACPELRALTPDESYWTLRLAYYERRMLGVRDPAEITALIRDLVPAEDAPAVTRLLVEGTAYGTPLAAGEQVRQALATMLTKLAPVLPELDRHCGPPPRRPEDRNDLEIWRDALVTRPREPGAAGLLQRLLELEIVSTTLGDEVSTGGTLPVELVQLSARTQNAFTRETRTGDDKLGGMSVNRFGGFLKSSWRANDWTWGRIDAATVLCRVVLHPDRVRRQLLADPRPAGEVLDSLCDRLFPGETRPYPDERRELYEGAAAELAGLSAAEPETGTALPRFADLCAWALHLRIVAEELPHVARAVRADRVEGANARSRGEVFLAEQDGLLADLTRASGAPAGVPEAEVPAEAARLRREALTAFDRAGIGREPLTEERGSDLMIRTATGAAAVGATVLDSDRSGLGAVRPVTRALRGVMLLPYWLIGALTSRAVLARSLALVGLAVGAVLLALSLFGALPTWLAGPATAAGAGALLGAFAFGALRTGTLLHGLVLVTPVVPLLGHAIYQAQRGDAASITKGLTTLGAVLALAAGLMVLGTLPAAGGSVLSAVDRLVDRRRRGGPAQGDPWTPAWLRRGRRVVALGGAVLRVLGMLLLIAAVAGLAWWTTTENCRELIDRIEQDNGPAARWVLGVSVAAAAIGIVSAYTLGRMLQRAGGREGAWRYRAVTDPAGTSAGWSVIYGLLYLVPSAAVLVLAPAWIDEPDELWLRALVVAALALGLFLLGVLPWLWPWRALRRIARAEVALVRAMPPVDRLVTVEPGEQVRDMIARDTGYRWFLTLPRGAEPALRHRGRALLGRVNAAHEQRRCGTVLVSRPRTHRTELRPVRVEVRPVAPGGAAARPVRVSVRPGRQVRLRLPSGPHEVAPVDGTGRAEGNGAVTPVQLRAGQVVRLVAHAGRIEVER